MIDQLPFWINLVFILIVIVTIGLFHLSNSKPHWITLGIVAWSMLHALLAYNGFYQNTEAMPPRFALVLIPPLLLFAVSLSSKYRSRVLERRTIQISTLLHFVRFPVEIILFQLFLYKMVPELMTFEGRNFDIIAGITAPIIAFLYWKNKIGRKTLLVWNGFALAFILFIFINGILSAELPFQQFGFDQPNKAMTHFPFILLPATIVPIVIWTHITDIIILRRKS